MSLLKVIQRSIVKLSRADGVQDGRYISSLLGWCTAAETPIAIKLQLMQLLSSATDRVCYTAFHSTSLSVFVDISLLSTNVGAEMISQLGSQSADDVNHSPVRLHLLSASLLHLLSASLVISSPYRALLALDCDMIHCAGT